MGQLFIEFPNFSSTKKITQAKSIEEIETIYIIIIFFSQSLHFNFLSSIYSIKKTSFWKCPAISRKSKLYINSLLCFIWNMKKINFRKFLSFSGELFWGTRDFRRPVSILLRTLTSGIIYEPVKKSISKWLNWKSIILAERIHLTS